MATTIVTPTEGIAGETAEQKYQRLYATSTETATTPPQTVVATLPAELVSTLEGLRQTVDELKAATPKPTTPTVVKQAWVKKIQEGDFDGAEQVLADSIRQSLESKFTETAQKAYSDAVAASTANAEMREYVASIRIANPQVAKFERYLQAPVAERVETARQAGRIKTTADFIREYKSAVDAEVKTIRDLGLQIRGEGKDEATTRVVDVISSSAVTPQQVTSNQIQQPTNSNSQGESSDEYFARRRADESRRRGLT